MQLTHLFTATFDDGSRIVQDINDTSVLEPDKRSTFFDVLEKAKMSPLVLFSLSGKGNNYSVDLTDGHFEINSTPVLLHTHSAKDFRIIFFRTHIHTFLQELNVPPKETSHIIAYNFGWQCELTGKDHQRIITVA